MSVNNFEKISRLLKFESEHDFYFIQIIRRPKENPGLREGKGNRTRCVKSYYVYSKEQLEMHREEIITLCEMFNARAYIKMNYCDASKIALHMIKEVSDYILSDNLRGIKRCYDSCCGKYSGGDKDRKYWIIDLDGCDEVAMSETLTEIIDECKPDGNKVIDIIKTKNGAHLLTKPFDKMKFSELISKIDTTITPDDIKKEALTILYSI